MVADAFIVLQGVRGAGAGFCQIGFVENDRGGDTHQLRRAKISINNEPVGRRSLGSYNREKAQVRSKYFYLATGTGTGQLIPARQNARNEPLGLVGDGFGFDTIATYRPQPFAFYTRTDLLAIRELEGHSAAKSCHDEWLLSIGQ